MLENRKDILGVLVDNIDEQELFSVLGKNINRKEGAYYIVTPNPEYILFTLENDWAKKIVNSADLSLPDGEGIVLASIALHGIILNKHTGVDTIEVLLDILNKRGGGDVLCIGGDTHGDVRKNTLTRAVQNLKKSYNDCRFTVYDPGHITDSNIVNIIDRIDGFDIVFLAIPMRWQLKVMEECQKKNVRGIIMGVGGAFDMISGELRRAPIKWRNRGLEWCWRLWQQPTRYRRIWRAVIVFPIRVVGQVILNKNIVQSTKKVINYIVNK